MQNVSTQKAENFSQPVKSALKSLLGRTLQADEEISIIAYRPHEAPQGLIRNQLAQSLNEQMDEMSKRVKDASYDELDEILDEGMRSARPDYRPIK